MPGPAPKPAGERRRANAPLANTVKLPPEGRSGPVPVWPMRGDAPDTWPEVWALPQAVQWEKLGWHRLVARYCWVLQIAEDPETMNAALLGEVRQLEDRLGLSPMALLRLRWEIDGPDADAPAAPSTRRPARTRLRVVDKEA